MNTLRYGFLVGSLVGILASACHSGAAADTILIEATANTTWKSGGMESAGRNVPLVVQAKTGDVLDIRVSGGRHGFVTIDKKGNENPSGTSALKFVQACGESPQDKPEAVFRETECSRFNKTLTASMKLEVLDRFQSDVNFWCVIHESDMWGTIKLRP